MNQRCIDCKHLHKTATYPQTYYHCPLVVDDGLKEKGITAETLWSKVQSGGKPTGCEIFEPKE